MNGPKYLIRPSDYLPFKNNGEDMYFIEGIENPNFYSRELLENEHEFLFWDSDDVSHFRKLNDHYNEWLSYVTRPDGHGGSKGGPEFETWLKNTKGISLDGLNFYDEVLPYKITQTGIKELANAIMNLGMSLRQSQLNGSDFRSGNEVLEEFLQENLNEYVSK